MYNIYHQFKKNKIVLYLYLFVFLAHYNLVY